MNIEAGYTKKNYLEPPPGNEHTTGRLTAANGIDPESEYQTVVTLFAPARASRLYHCAGPVKRVAGIARTARLRIDPVRSATRKRGRSASEPTRSMRVRHSHSASAYAHYRVRDSSQSTFFPAHSPYRPYLTVAGYQFPLFSPAACP